MILKAAESDLDAVEEIYNHIHTWERQKKLCTGWLADIYPTRATAKKAIGRGDLFVCKKDEKILATAIINQEQVDVYAKGSWKYEAADDEVMVLHTLAVDPAAAREGIGRQFVAFYEDYARKAGCKVLRMDTNAKNTVARKFYAKLGYREAGICPCEFNGIPDVALVLLEKEVFIPGVL